MRPYAFRRRANYAFPGYGTYGFSPFTPRVSREQEIEFLKGQAETLKNELSEIENEISKLSVEKE